MHRPAPFGIFCRAPHPTPEEWRECNEQQRQANQFEFWHGWQGVGRHPVFCRHPIHDAHEKATAVQHRSGIAHLHFFRSQVLCKTPTLTVRSLSLTLRRPHGDVTTTLPPADGAGALIRARTQTHTHHTLPQQALIPLSPLQTHGMSSPGEWKRKMSNVIL